MADMVKMQDWLGAIPSKSTRKGYKNSTRRFEEFLGKPIEELLALDDVELGHIIEKYFAWMTDKGVTQNSR